MIDTNGPRNGPVVDEHCIQHPQTFAWFLGQYLSTWNSRKIFSILEEQDWDRLKQKQEFMFESHAAQKGGKLSNSERKRLRSGVCAELFLEASLRELERQIGPERRELFQLLTPSNIDQAPIYPKPDFNMKLRWQYNYEVELKNDHFCLMQTECDAVALSRTEQNQGTLPIVYAFDATTDTTITGSKKWRDVILGRTLANPCPQIVDFNIIYCGEEIAWERTQNDTDWHNIYIPHRRGIEKIAYMTKKSIRPETPYQNGTQIK